MISGNDPYYPYGSNYAPVTDGWFVSQPGSDTPDSYPPQPNAGVHIAWGVISIIPIKEFSYEITGGMQMADPEATYQTYQTITDSFFCDTTLTNFPSDVPPAITPVYNYFASQANNGYQCEIHWSINIDNVTAPPAELGSWVQKKAHMDGHLTAGNIKGPMDIYTPLQNFIPFLQSIAKY